MNTIKALRLLTRPCTGSVVRSMGSAGGVRPKLPPPSEKFKRLQEHFQLANDIPVHLKGGKFDYFLYYVTLSLCAIGVAKTLHVIYLYSFPQKPAAE